MKPHPVNIKPDLPVVLSASRRTDLVSCYPEYFVEKLAEYAPESVHTVVIWTKNPEALIKNRGLIQCLKKYDQIYIHLTITGLGGTPLEPGIPPWETVCSMVGPLVNLTGSPRRISWRFDPLITAVFQGKTISNHALFPVLAERIAGWGIQDVRTSWVTPYRKVVRRTAQKGIRLLFPDKEERHRQAGAVVQAAESFHLCVHFCSVEGFARSRCIDGTQLTDLHPSGRPCSLKKAKGQRTLCGCTESIDIGWYSLRCKNRCVYCYAETAPE